MISRRAFLLAPAPLVMALPNAGVPDFQGKSLDGSAFSKSALKGKPVLIQFWATWCGYCRRDQPAIESIAERYRGKLAVLAVSVREEKAAVERYLARSPRKCRIVLTRDTNLTDIFQPQGFPYYVLLDSDGRLAGEQPGAGGLEGLQQLLTLVGLRG